jgi:NAD(P)-dependent dehydrogenase (short-subunit alcohol dehydrogenase family)
MALQLTGKRAVVTGGSRGIGFAIADALAREGADLALLARDRERLGTAAKQLAADHGRRVLALPADTTDDPAVRAAIARTAGELGGVDILVNNAAVPAAQGSPRALADLVDGDLLAAIDAKVLGYLRCARAAAPYMIAQGWGRIINISGLAARSVSTPSGSIRNVAIARADQDPGRRTGSRRHQCDGRAPGPDRDRAHPGHDRRIRRRPRQHRSRGRSEPGRGHQHRPHHHRCGGC